MALPVEVEDGPALEEAGASTAPTPCFVPTTSPVDNATATPGSFRLSPSLSLFPLSSPLSPPSAQLSLRSSSLPLPLSSYLFPPPLLLTLPSLPPFLEYTAPLSSSFRYFTFSYLSLLLPLSLSLRVYSTGEAFLLILLLLFLVWLDVARLVVAPSPLFLSVSGSEREKRERRDGRDVLFVEVGSNRQPSGWKRRDGPPRTP